MQMFHVEHLLIFNFCFILLLEFKVFNANRNMRQIIQYFSSRLYFQVTDFVSEQFRFIMILFEFLKNTV